MYFILPEFLTRRTHIFIPSIKIHTCRHTRTRSFLSDGFPQPFGGICRGGVARYSRAIFQSDEVVSKHPRMRGFILFIFCWMEFPPCDWLFCRCGLIRFRWILHYLGSMNFLSVVSVCNTVGPRIITWCFSKQNNAYFGFYRKIYIRLAHFHLPQNRIITNIKRNELSQPLSDPIQRSTSSQATPAAPVSAAVVAVDAARLRQIYDPSRWRFFELPLLHTLKAQFSGLLARLATVPLWQPFPPPLPQSKTFVFSGP